MKKIVIVNMGMGNIESVAEGFRRVGADVLTMSRPEDIEGAAAVVLPGVGAFGDGMANLCSKGFIEPIKRYAAVEKRPLLGICLGMQLMADESEEFGLHKGLGLIRGRVIRLKPAMKGYRVPNIGWCDVRVLKEGVLFSKANDGQSFYFAHSYHLKCADERDAAAFMEYNGEKITAAVERENLFGVQFHPEKSQDAGLDMLEAFVKFAKKDKEAIKL